MRPLHERTRALIFGSLKDGLEKLEQRSLVDGLIPEHAAIKALDDVEALLDWKRIEPQLETLHSRTHGEKSWPPLMMFKAPLLQCWYNLSDPALEKPLARDLLFRRFIGLDIAFSVVIHPYPSQRSQV